MKKFALFVCFLCCGVVSSFAQNTPLTFQSVSGLYQRGGVQTGLYLDEQGQFAFVEYETIISGTYEIKKDDIILHQYKPKETFIVYGRKNPELKKGIRLTIPQWFKEELIYLKTDSNYFQRIFDGKNRPSSPYYVVDLPERIAKITIGIHEQNSNELYKNNAYSFHLDENQNDFFLQFIENNKDKSLGKNKKIIKNNGKIKGIDFDWDQILEAQSKDTVNLESVKFMKAIISAFSYIEKLDKNDIYVSTNLKVIASSSFDPGKGVLRNFNENDYVLDEKSNKFISKKIYQPGADYTNIVKKNNYQNTDVLMKYQTIKNFTKSTIDFDSILLNMTPLIVEKGNVIK